MSILSQLQDTVRTYSESVVQTAADRLWEVVSNAAPKGQTLALTQSVETSEPSWNGQGWTFEIKATAPYASYTDVGTGVYAGGGRIYGNPILAFAWPKRGGGIFYFRSVAGTPAQHWFEQPMAERYREALEFATS